MVDALVFFLFDLNENENEKFFIKLHLIRPLTTVVSTHFLMLYPHRDYWTGALGHRSRNWVSLGESLISCNAFIANR